MERRGRRRRQSWARGPGGRRAGRAAPRSPADRRGLPGSADSRGRPGPELGTDRTWGAVGQPWMPRSSQSSAQQIALSGLRAGPPVSPRRRAPFAPSPAQRQALTCCALVTHLSSLAGLDSAGHVPGKPLCIRPPPLTGPQRLLVPTQPHHQLLLGVPDPVELPLRQHSRPCLQRFPGPKG